MDDLLRMQLLAGLITESEYKERSNRLNLKEEINNISQKITKNIIDGFEENKITINNSIEFESELIPIVTNIKKDKSQNNYGISGTAFISRKIKIDIFINPDIDPISYQKEIEHELQTVIWHELKHISQFNTRNQTKIIPRTQPRDIDYYLYSDEIEAYAEELKHKSELTNIDIEQLIGDFGESINNWINRKIQHKITKGGFSEEDAIKYTGTKEDVESLISQIKSYLNKNYGLSLK